MRVAKTLAGLIKVLDNSIPNLKLLEMKTKQMIEIISLVISILAIPGCTSRTWYEIVKQGAENNCRNQPPSESERCLENLNKKTYEEYEKERSYQKSP
jgi:hypothetical protein